MANTILVTGANRGIGLELSRQYSAAGWRVLACCRNPEEAVELKKLAEHSGNKILVLTLDVGRVEDISRLADDLRKEKIDILFNNAGINGPKQQEFGLIDAEGWMAAMRVNVLAPYYMAVAFLDQLAAGKRRLLAIMGTQLGSIADNTSGGKYVYRSSKAAVHMVGKSLSIDLKPRGITTLLLHPGWVRTDMGGAQAALSVEESVQGLRQVLEQANADDNGKLIAYDGRIIPW
ncbi:Short-chain dehydrogenase [Geoalkalibacter ferrihydriticus]|uniref:Short-chain dehydrogenase n=2 Tax=Geoalkalibacter ferrihydriticus TaxID=392333 RepID=A0A0C2HRI1_9BACT|nr:SDR family oxidoreductase [Geoalkalibacter ferrihydriticus]KIH77470.1 short-chain dehydrogenase [Geoalkalibacter ferrihydriticus DSM 17813]SDM13671.1 Short-chain dehydrogenase [Geoalkalibacter ferrihydriticus]